MAYKRKYRKGALITSIGELAEQEFICHGPNVYHKGWFLSWQISFAKQMIERGFLYRAERIDGTEVKGSEG